MALVLSVVHLHKFLLLILSVPFFKILFFKFGVDKSREWSTIPACSGLMCFFNRGNTKGTHSWKMLCLMFVYVNVVVYKFASRQIL